MQNMVWNVYYKNINGKKIEKFNIFDHYSFNEDVKRIYKKHKDDFETFSKEVESSLMYYFWSKAEWEIILGPWTDSSRYKEEMEIIIDVYDQIKLNWDIFIKYVWEQAHARKTNKKDK